MITIKNYNFDYYRYIFITSGIILFGILLKVFDKRPYVLLETILLTFGLLFSLIYLSDNRKFDYLKNKLCISDTLINKKIHSIELSNWLKSFKSDN